MQCGRDICSEAYANNVKCMSSSAPGHTFSCSKFLKYILYIQVGPA